MRRVHVAMVFGALVGFAAAIALVLGLDLGPLTAMLAGGVLSVAGLCAGVEVTMR